MTFSEYKKVVFVVWKWQHLTEKDVHAFYSLKNIENREDLLVIEVHDDIPVEDMNAILNEVSKDNNTDLLLLFHKTSLYSQEQKYAISVQYKSSNLVLKEFGGGEDYIYYDPQRDTGWIDQIGGWADGCMFLVQDKKVVIPTMLNASGQLLEAYFTPVWQHYLHDHASLLLKAHYTIMIELENRHTIKKEPLGQYFAQIMPEQSIHLHELLDNINMIRKDAAIGEKVPELKNWLLNTIFQSNTEIRTLNEKLVDLLDAI